MKRLDLIARGNIGEVVGGSGESSGRISAQNSSGDIYIYNLTGAKQKLNTTILHDGVSKKHFICIQNDGNESDAFNVQGTKENSLFSVKYLNGTTNVTAAMVAGTFNTSTLAHGESLILKAAITAKTPLVGQKRKFSIQATSAADSAAADKGLIKATSN